MDFTEVWEFDAARRNIEKTIVKNETGVNFNVDMDRDLLDHCSVEQLIAYSPCFDPSFDIADLLHSSTRRRVRVHERSRVGAESSSGRRESIATNFANLANAINTTVANNATMIKSSPHANIFIHRDTLDSDSLPTSSDEKGEKGEERKGERGEGRRDKREEKIKGTIQEEEKEEEEIEEDDQFVELEGLMKPYKKSHLTTYQLLESVERIFQEKNSIDDYNDLDPINRGEYTLATDFPNLLSPIVRSVIENDVLKKKLRLRQNFSCI